MNERRHPGPPAPTRRRLCDETTFFANEVPSARLVCRAEASHERLSVLRQPEGASAPSPLPSKASFNGDKDVGNTGPLPARITLCHRFRGYPPTSTPPRPEFPPPGLSTQHECIVILKGLTPSSFVPALMSGLGDAGCRGCSRGRQPSRQSRRRPEDCGKFNTVARMQPAVTRVGCAQRLAGGNPGLPSTPWESRP